MKRSLLSQFAFTLFFACIGEQKTGLISNECHWPGPQSDSILLDDFKRHMKVRNTPAPIIPKADTMYRFRGHGGWGEFDYLCSVYCDSTGYKASLTSMVNRYKDGIGFEEKIRSIGAGEWQQIRWEFQNINFWCDSFDYDRYICVDAPEYQLLAKEGSKFREVEWDECETGLQSMKIVSKKIKDICGFPDAPGVASYSLKGDSVIANIFFNTGEHIFYQKLDFQYHGKLLYNWGEVGQLTIHKRDLDSLRRVVITEYGIDGSVRRVNVTQLRRAD